MMIPHGATINCSLWVCLWPNWAQSFLCAVCSSTGMGWPQPLKPKPSLALSLSTSSETFDTSTGSASCGWASCVRWRHSFSWKQAWPWSLWTVSTAPWSARAQVFLPGTTGSEQWMIAQIWLRQAWVGQNRSWLFTRETLQLGSPQHGWPTVTPSITTTKTFFPIPKCKLQASK